MNVQPHAHEASALLNGTVLYYQFIAVCCVFYDIIIVQYCSL